MQNFYNIDKLNFLTAGMPLVTGKGGYPKALDVFIIFFYSLYVNTSNSVILLNKVPTFCTNIFGIIHKCSNL